MKKTLKIEGMTCGHCEKAVKEALKEVADVENVLVNLEEGTAEVEGNNLEDGALKEAVDEAGYKVVSID